MKRKICAALLLLAMISAAGCGDKEPINDDPTPSETVVSQAVNSDTAATVDNADTENSFSKVRMYDNVNTFSTYLFSNVMDSAENENTLISPLSVYLALSMLENGADGDTFNELNNSLNGYFNLSDALAEFMRLEPLPKEELNSFARYYNDTTDKNVLAIANAFWVADRDDLKPSDTFMSILRDYYNSDFFCSPMNADTINTINNWVSDNTNGKISDLLNENSPVSPDTAAIILNAVSFEDKWLIEYDPSESFTDIFYNSDGTDGSAVYMYSEENALHDEEYAKGFVKSYKNDRFSFAVLMPNEDVDFNEYAERLYTNDVFRDCISNSEGKTVRAYLPKFEFDYDCSLSETLMSMGIKLAFNEIEADFTSMFGEDSVYVGDVLHKTHIEVNDEGTQAQAATAVEILEKGVILEEEMEEIRIDRPFFFCIYDNEIKAPIFIGAVKNLMGE